MKNYKVHYIYNGYQSYAVVRANNEEEAIGLFLKAKPFGKRKFYYNLYCEIAY